MSGYLVVPPLSLKTTLMCMGMCMCMCMCMYIIKNTFKLNNQTTACCNWAYAIWLLDFRSNKYFHYCLLLIHFIILMYLMLYEADAIVINGADT